MRKRVLTKSPLHDQWECIHCGERHWYSKLAAKVNRHKHCTDCGEANWEFYTEYFEGIPFEEGLRM